MLAPSKTRFGLPEVWSTRAGMRPLATAVVYQLYDLHGCCALEWKGGGWQQVVRVKGMDGVKLADCLWFRKSVLTVDFKEPGLLLLILAEFQLVYIVLETQFLKGDGDFVAVRGCSWKFSENSRPVLT